MACQQILLICSVKLLENAPLGNFLSFGWITVYATRSRGSCKVSSRSDRQNRQLSKVRRSQREVTSLAHDRSVISRQNQAAKDFDLSFVFTSEINYDSRRVVIE
jgi:hypothetical protein